MKTTNVLRLLSLLMLFTNHGCSSQTTKREGSKSATEKTTMPRASAFVSSPLRNKIKLELSAPVSKVWDLVGHLERLPEYSSGLLKVDTEYNIEKDCTEYTCYFLPVDDKTPSETHREIMKWYEPNKGFASISVEPTKEGYYDCLTLVTLIELKGKTIMTWGMYFNAKNEESLKQSVEEFDLALNQDIAPNLVNTFGGRILENFVFEH